MVADNYIHVHLACGAIARVSGDITEKELIILNDMVQKLMDMTVDKRKPGRLF